MSRTLTQRTVGVFILALATLWAASPAPGQAERGQGEALTPRSQTPQPARAGAVSVEVDHVGGTATSRRADLALLGLDGAADRPGATLTVGSQKWPLEDVIRVRFVRPERRTPEPPGLTRRWWLLLRSGDMLPGSIGAPPPIEGDEEEALHFAVEGWAEPIDVPLSAVHALFPNPAVVGRPGRPRDPSSSLRRLEREAQALDSKDDTVVLEATGTAGSAPRVTGIVDTISADSVVIESDRLGMVDIPYEKIRALVLAPLELPGAPASAKETDGARPGRNVRLRLANAGVLHGELVGISGGGVEIQHALLGRRRLPLAAVLELGLQGGRVTYLSDLNPIRTDEHAGLLFNDSDRFAFKRDANVLDGPIRMRGRTWRKGLGVHSYSLLEFELPPQAERFQATIGLDDIARPPAGELVAGDVGSVVFRVRVDGQLLFDKPLTWRDDPLAVEVRLRQGKLLSLEVDFGGVSGSMISTLDRANWADARLVRPAASTRGTAAGTR